MLTYFSNILRNQSVISGDHTNEFCHPKVGGHLKMFQVLYEIWMQLLLPGTIVTSDDIDVCFKHGRYASCYAYMRYCDSQLVYYTVCLSYCEY